MAPVNITGDFALQASPASMTLTSGVSQAYPYTISAIPIAGFTSDLNLQRDVTYDSIPQTGNTMAACGVLFVPISIPWSTSISVSITVSPQNYGSTCLPGHAYYLHLRAWAGSGVPQHNITLALDVALTSDFSISTQSPTQTLGSTGGIAYYQFALHRVGNFGDQVNFTTSGLPAGVTATFLPQSVSLTGQDQSMILKIPSTASIPTFTLNATAASNSQTHGVPLSLVVQQGAPSPATLITPSDEATLTGPPWTFQWNTGAGVDVGLSYQLDLGSNPGTSDLYSTNPTSGTSTSVSLTLPNSIYATLRSKIAGVWRPQSYHLSSTACYPSSRDHERNWCRWKSGRPIRGSRRDPQDLREPLH